MKSYIDITVEVPDNVYPGKINKLFSVRSVQVVCSDFDFKAVVKGLRCIYPDPSAVISFREF